MTSNRKRFLIGLFLAGVMVLLAGCAAEGPLSAPGVTLTVDPAGEPQQVSSGVQLLVLLTVLSIAPAILSLATSFTRIVIVLSLLRNAMGTPTIPPNQVLIGLALLLTFFVMAPIYGQINDQALKPYSAGEITQEVALDRATEPLRTFMFAQTREKDLQLFVSLSEMDRPETPADIPTVVLLPAFVISELRAAFIMGFAIYIPFLIIDMVVSSILLAMGMMMLPPPLISLPFKILLFVMVDGWYLIARSLMLSFR
ncbi:MAG: flagellar type III secretion system pore protein FliP [Anaerolineales bacterium]|nr:flagellar type III secretion system pore protein FliP [Anaerolineales bacterium]